MVVFGVLLLAALVVWRSWWEVRHPERYDVCPHHCRGGCWHNRRGWW